jgi:hypothetical protein
MTMTTEQENALKIAEANYAFAAQALMGIRDAQENRRIKLGGDNQLSEAERAATRQWEDLQYEAGQILQQARIKR